ncbi:MAG: MFS transporter [Deltaproteobacteria bacterium]|nr:MFS transporter [Deltaproteobacteria bacterium]
MATTGPGVVPTLSMTVGQPHLARFAGLPRTFWILWVGTLVNRLGGFVVPFLSLYLTRGRGLSVAHTGLVVSLYGLGLIGAGPLGGVIADRVGRRAAILLGLCAGGLCAIGLGLAESTATIALCTFLFALIGETYRPGVQAAVADLVPPARRPQAYGLIYWAINLGFAVAVIAAGLVVEEGYSLLFFIDGATSLVYAAIVMVAVPETKPANAAVEPGLLSGLTAPLGDRVFALFLLISLSLVAIFWQHQVALPVDITNHGVSAAGYGRLMAVNGVLIVILQPLASTWLSRRDRSTVLAVSCMLVGVGFGMNAVVNTAALYGVAIAIWTLGEIGNFPTASALVADLAPAHMRGRYQGLYSMTGGVAAVAAPAIGGAVLQHAGRVPLWGGCAALGLVAGLAQLARGRGMRARLATPERL